jgi:hypothetical protein
LKNNTWFVSQQQSSLLSIQESRVIRLSHWSWPLKREYNLIVIIFDPLKNFSLSCMFSLSVCSCVTCHAVCLYLLVMVKCKSEFLLLFFSLTLTWLLRECYRLLRNFFLFSSSLRNRAYFFRDIGERKCDLLDRVMYRFYRYIEVSTSQMHEAIGQNGDC